MSENSKSPAAASLTGKPRRTLWHFYDGAIYGQVVERGLDRLYDRVAAHVRERGSKRVLDACCGVGGLSVRLGQGGAEVLGVDLSPRNVRYAARRGRRAGLDKVQFALRDVTALEDHADGSFDAATVLMALHEMPQPERLGALRELSRVAARVVVVDFTAPMPHSVHGWFNRTIEFMAGPTHFRGFRDYQRRGGLGPLMEEAGLEVTHDRTLQGDTLRCVELRRPA